jgi:hypothetical protein
VSRNPRRTCARTLRPRRPRSCASYLSQPCAAACAAPSQPATLPGDSWLERHYSDQGGLPWIRPNPLRVVGFGEGLLDRRGRQAEDGHTTPSLACRGFGRPALLLSLAAAAVAPSRLTTLPILSAGKLLFVDDLLCDTPTTPDFELWTRPRGPLHYQRPSGVAARPPRGPKGTKLKGPTTRESDVLKGTATFPVCYHTEVARRYTSTQLRLRAAPRRADPTRTRLPAHTKSITCM